jgi:hypothetical protein
VAQPTDLVTEAEPESNARPEPQPVVGDRDGSGRGITRPTGLALLAIATLAVAMALIQQDWSQSAASHFALIRSLAAGTAEIDPRVSVDTAYIGGRYYANKAPGLAFVTLPAYLALRAAGWQEGGLEPLERYRERLWQVGLFAAVLPAIALALLMLVAVERVTPGVGGLTAVLLATGTLLLPFTTLLFGHVLSATVGFAAFVVLLLDRERGPSTRLVALGGLLAGLAIVVEYPLGIVAVVLAAYAALGTNALRRFGAYALGGVVGVLPLAAYNTWAFGSPTVLSYTNVLTEPGDGGPPKLGSEQSTGFYGVNLPDPRVAASLLVSEKGLFVVAPLCAVALVGLPALWRAGRKPEALVCAAVPALFLAYNASYYIPFGGQGPGPRFLVPAIPFLALPLGMVLKRHLWPALAVALVSIAVMAVVTFTNPLTSDDHTIGESLRELARGEVVWSPLEIPGLWALLPSAILLAIAVGLAIASARPSRPEPREAVVAVVAVLAWAVMAVAAPRLLPADPDHGTVSGTLAVVVLAVILVATLALVARRGAVLAAAAVPLVLLAVPAVVTRQRLALLVTLCALALLLVAARATHARAAGGPGRSIGTA